jgi:hypothetical protein
MALSSTPYNGARLEIGKGTINLSTATIRALLTTSSYVPNFDTHKFLSDVTSELPVANGYARVTLASPTWTQDNANDRAVLSSSAATWAASGGPLTMRYCVLFVDTGDAATSLLLTAILLDTTPTDVTVQDGGSYTLTPDATSGWAKL